MVLPPEPEQEGKGGAPEAGLLHTHGLQLPPQMGTSRPCPRAPGTCGSVGGSWSLTLLREGWGGVWLG